MSHTAKTNKQTKNPARMKPVPGKILSVLSILPNTQNVSGIQRGIQILQKLQSEIQTRLRIQTQSQTQKQNTHTLTTTMTTIMKNISQ